MKKASLAEFRGASIFSQTPHLPTPALPGSGPQGRVSAQKLLSADAPPMLDSIMPRQACFVKSKYLFALPCENLGSFV